MYKIDYSEYLKRLESAGFTPAQAKAMLSVMLRLLERSVPPDLELRYNKKSIFNYLYISFFII